MLTPELLNCLDLTNLDPTSRRLAKQSTPLSLELGKAGVGFLPGWSLLPSTAAPTRVTPGTFKSGICRCAFWKGVFNIITCISILTRVSLYFTPQHTVYYQFEFWNMYNCDFDIYLTTRSMQQLASQMLCWIGLSLSILACVRYFISAVGVRYLRAGGQ